MFIDFRAIYGRIENTLQGLTPPFRLNRPVMCLVTSSETRHPAKAPNFSVNWVIGQEFPEIINTNTGKSESGKSRLCKQVFAQRFLRILGKLRSLSGIEDNPPVEYSEAKAAMETYKVIS